MHRTTRDPERSRRTGAEVVKNIKNAMENKITINHIFLIAFNLAALHFIFLKGNIYGNRGWVDIPLHIIFGMFLGLIFIWWGNRKKDNIPSFKFLVFGLISFALLGGLLWEGTEIILWKFFPVAGDYVAIKPAPLRDFFADLAFDSLGSLIWLMFIKPKR